MKIETKIDFWKKRLLDFGKQNKLINLPLGKSNKRVSRASIIIEIPSASELWKTFSNIDDGISFPVVNKADKDTDDSENQRETEPAIPFAFPNGYRTNQLPFEACKTFRSLMHKSKEFIDNKGLNALYLTFGFLNWKENGLGGKSLRSPILLIPISIFQDNVSAPFEISRIDSEIVSNNTLLYKLKSDFNIDIPEYTEGDDWKQYLQIVSEKCSGFNWKIDSKYAQIAMISFQKMAMYNDIAQNAEMIAKNPIIRLLNGEGEEEFETEVFSDITNYDHDKTDPKDVFSVVDADSSQQDAIVLAKKGASFVLQGPPGTGKSQTITNIISELLSQGKSVLFVSEKLAALQVVYNRLSVVGISDFCLTLHNPNAKRREIMNQLQNSINLASERVSISQKAIQQLNQLVEERRKLNDYVNQLHVPVPPLNESIYHVNGYIASLEQYPDVDFVYQDSENVSLEEYNAMLSLISDFMLIIKKSGYQQNNLWLGSKLNTVTNLFRQKFSSDTVKLRNSADNGKQIYEVLYSLIGESGLSDSISDILNWASLLECSLKSPHISYNVTTRTISEVKSLINQCQDARYKKLMAFEMQSKIEEYFEREFIVIQRLQDAVLDNKMEGINSVIPEYNSAFDTIEEEICTEKIAAFSKERAMYVEVCIAYSEFLEKDQELRTQKADHDNKKLMLEDEMISEEKILSEIEKELSAVQGVVTQKYYDTILTLDVCELLKRYKNEYTTILRILKSSYKKDRDTLKDYSKHGKKTSYTKALQLLNNIFSAQIVKMKYDEKRGRIEELKNRINEQQSEINLLIEQIQDCTEQLQKTKTDAIEKHQFLCSKMEEIQIICSKNAENEKSNCENIYKEMSECLNDTVDDFTNFELVHSNVVWLYKFVEICDKFEINLDYRKQVCEISEDFNNRLTAVHTRFVDWKNTYEEICRNLFETFDESVILKLSDCSLQELVDRITEYSNSYSMLEYYVDYKNIMVKADSTGVAEYIRKVEELKLDSDDILPSFKKCFFRSWLDHVLPKFDAITTFRGEKQEKVISDFKTLDKEHMDIARARLKAKLVSELPNIDSFAVGGAEVTILRRELAKQRKLMPLRKLIAALPTLLPALKPCIMMSPLSVSTYFRNTDYKFDTVIFDEASQVRTEDAICSIFRGSQVIIAGDSKQLPPTNFFSTSFSDSDDFNEENGEFDDAGAYESLLDEASSLPTQTLLWHYRSKNEQLIAFSNQKIYNGNLITFPSAVEKGDDIGVEYIYTQNGIYDRGGRNGNRIEAERVAEIVFEHIRKKPGRSLGVIAFNEKQQTVIEDAIIRKRQENPQYEHFFKDNNSEPFFIRNLETVQGDERDTIIFSIGFGYDKDGKFLMNFGPLSKNGGERRLNVAITRARYNLKLVGSIMPTDISINKINSIGPKLLRQYIDYAINGSKAILAETQVDKEVSFDSPFEEAVYTYLVEKGYNIATQVGCSGYRIDMAVRHPKYNGRFAIGIECDGASYHSARTARERDRLRQTVLEDMGWKIYRIWSTDWIKDPNSEKEKLLIAIEKAISTYHEPNSFHGQKSNHESDEKYLKVSVDKQDDTSGKMQVQSPYAGKNVKSIPIQDIEDTMIRILEMGYGYDVDSLMKTTAKYGYEWKRMGKMIRNYFDIAIQNLLRKGKIVIESDAVKVTDKKVADCRKSSYDDYGMIFVD